LGIPCNKIHYDWENCTGWLSTLQCTEHHLALFNAELMLQNVTARADTLESCRDKEHPSCCTTTVLNACSGSSFGAIPKKEAWYPKWSVSMPLDSGRQEPKNYNLVFGHCRPSTLQTCEEEYDIWNYCTITTLYLVPFLYRNYPLDQLLFAFIHYHIL
jgi:hypothetical protein